MMLDEELDEKFCSLKMISMTGRWEVDQQEDDEDDDGDPSQHEMITTLILIHSVTFMILFFFSQSSSPFRINKSKLHVAERE